MSGYYRGRGRPRRTVARDGRINRANKYAGPCHYCGQDVPAGKGQLFGSGGEFKAVHLPATWHGSPVSGRYVNGCPGETDELNGPILARRGAS